MSAFSASAATEVGRTMICVAIKQSAQENNTLTTGPEPNEQS